MKNTSLIHPIALTVQHILKDEQLLDKKVIVAVSGGLDSMVLAAILLELNVEFALAHCNFHLRADESNADEAFVADWAKDNSIPLFIQHFDTNKILEEEGGNLQEVARNLRYNWFEQLRIDNAYDYIATAHHADDSVETMLMNFFKGTGIKGLHGILLKQGNIIRPLLKLTRDEIKRYASEKNISWREDSSNRKLDYTRNKIRHQLMPVLKDIFPNVAANLQGNIERLKDAGTIYDVQIEKLTKKLMEQRGSEYYIPGRKLKNIQPLSTIIYEILKPFNFLPSQTQQVLQLLQAETGKYVSSSTHRIIRNRELLIIAAQRTEEASFVLVEEQEIEAGNEKNIGHFKLKFEAQTFDGDIINLPQANTIAAIDYTELTFPLIIRPWKQGDYFYPLGMKKKKKIARFLIDQKIPLHEKERIWVVESDKRVVWVIGQRLDDRFKIKPHTKRLLKIAVI